MHLKLKMLCTNVVISCAAAHTHLEVAWMWAAYPDLPWLVVVVVAPPVVPARHLVVPWEGHRQTADEDGRLETEDFEQPINALETKTVGDTAESRY